jgi:CMP/dCMP kinase
MLHKEVSQQVPVITIDGPSGSGKGTLAGLLSNELGWNLLDSGALYRILSWVTVDRQIAIDAVDQMVQLAQSLDVKFEQTATGLQILVDGRDISRDIRTEGCGNTASKIAALIPVREALLAFQRDCRQFPGLVADGRDMGTVIFPDAVLKFFLTASAEERTKRRYKQLREKGFDVNITALLQEVVERDERDRNRAVSPLKPADDAIIIDCTELSISEVQQKMQTLVSANIY